MAEGKVTVFKILVVSKAIHLALIINVPVTVIKESNRIQKKLFRCRKTLK